MMLPQGGEFANVQNLVSGEEPGALFQDVALRSEELDGAAEGAVDQRSNDAVDFPRRLLAASGLVVIYLAEFRRHAIAGGNRARDHRCGLQVDSSKRRELPE